MSYRELAVVPDDLPKRHVVCKDCRFFGGYTEHWYQEGELQPERVAKCNADVDSVTGLRLPTFTICHQRNKHNDCTLYRRKWWKFWVSR